MCTLLDAMQWHGCECESLPSAWPPMRQASGRSTPRTSSVAHRASFTILPPHKLPPTNPHTLTMAMQTLSARASVASRPAARTTTRTTRRTLCVRAEAPKAPQTPEGAAPVESAVPNVETPAPAAPAAPAKPAGINIGGECGMGVRQCRKVGRSVWSKSRLGRPPPTLQHPPPPPASGRSACASMGLHHVALHPPTHSPTQIAHALLSSLPPPLQT